MSSPPARGAAPPDAQGEEEAARWVQGMFSRVAGRYDLLNHLLSLNVDRSWRARAVRRLRPILRRPGARVLDICCGTGDLLLALESECGATVVGSDFCHPMLVGAQRKIARRRSRAVLVEADALALPFPDGSLDLITAAFGFRNLANYEKGLAGIRRALKPEGALAILEFSQPKNAAFAALYGFYSSKVLPAVGGLISGDRNAYRYLPESVRRFPNAEDLADSMRTAGFTPVEYERMTGGIVALHVGYAR
jgi:demethylmenaquinone methyltransferase/2-methoxy-6-polyprenyl-1,4-benzoquinol methylase